MIVTNVELSPPRCLQTVRTHRADPSKTAEFAGLFASDEEEAKLRAFHESQGRSAPYVPVREEVVVWHLVCSCGAKSGKLFGVRVDDHFAGPVRFACTECLATVPIFDGLADGWNAETAKRKRKARKEPKMNCAMFCRKCKENVWHPIALLTYQGDNYKDVPKERLQDYFDVIGLGGTCASCGALALGFTEECA